MGLDTDDGTLETSNLFVERFPFDPGERPAKIRDHCLLRGAYQNRLDLFIRSSRNCIDIEAEKVEPIGSHYSLFTQGPEVARQGQLFRFQRGEGKRRSPILLEQSDGGIISVRSNSPAIAK